MRDGGAATGAGHASGGVGFDGGTTRSGKFYRSFQPGAGSLVRRRNHHPLYAPSALGRVDVPQVPPLRQNSDGATPPLVDPRSLRIQRAYHSDGDRPPSGLLVPLAAAPV